MQIILATISVFLTFIIFFNIKTLKTKQKIKKDIQISVIIPARNEEINIKNLLDSLKIQTVLPKEIIVVNDKSEDNTRLITAEYENVKIVDIYTYDKNWTGKNYACYKGAQNAKYETLLFLDADLTLESTAIETLINNFEKENVLSVLPYHNIEKYYETLSMFFNLISIAAVGICFPIKDKTIGLFGTLIMLNKDLYFSFGGHEKVKDKIIEDYELGELLRKNNIKRDMFLGYGFIEYRMYKGGIKDLIWGWSKNFSSAALKTPLPYFAIVLIWISGYYEVSIEMIKNIILFFQGNITFDVLIPYLLVYLFASIVLYIKTKKIGSFSVLSCLFYIIPLTGFTLIFIFSIILKLIVKRVKWKNRWHAV